MPSAVTTLSRARRAPTISADAVLTALPDPVLVLDERNVIRHVNLEAEEFFELGAARLINTPLSSLLPGDCPVFGLIGQVRSDNARVSEYGVTIETPRIRAQIVTVQGAPLGEPIGHIVLSFHERSIASRIDHQLTHRSAARSVAAMALMLAHEVKNPLSGIRGAAQLLEQSASGDDRVLTRLICEEADRIVSLVDRMEVFSDRRPLDRSALNIHTVLEHVRRLATSGFARHIRFIERYDPSLPPVYANRDQLVQVLLNLVKNAAEAAPEVGGEIVLSTSYQQGVRLAVPGGTPGTHLPILVSVQDNGDGIPEDIRPHLFDPFVTTKRNGTGLGLALVAKIIGDHGGVIEFESGPRRTVFKLSLPMAPKAGTDVGLGDVP